MEKSRVRPFPKWAYVLLAVCGLLASGLYGGILSSEGFTAAHMLKAAGFGLFGLLMFWAALSNR